MSRPIFSPMTAAMLLFVCASAQAQIQIGPARIESINAKEYVLDLDAGKILGAAIGMDEAAARKILEDNHITEIKKRAYASHFALMSPACRGIIFNFRGKRELNDIYTNSREVRLSNGLKLGDSLTEFTKRLGQPSPPKALPSGVGQELIYPVGRFELSVIVLDAKPEVVHALALRKRGKP